MYNYTDHLGNIRLSYTYDENTGLIKIMEENHYYPFGLKHDSYNTNRLGYSAYTDEDEIINFVLDEQPKFIGDGSYQYKYNGKELQDELGLNWYDYQARNYDPALGRWMNFDPLAEMSRRYSPYAYCLDNPIFFIDPDGMRADDWRINYTDKNGQHQTFTFNGGNTAIPDNEFVKDFVAAYKHNVGNGGGDSMKAIAENPDIIVDVQQTSGDSNYENNSSPLANDVLNWNPNMGLMTDNGSFLSPATILEHEADHALGDKTGTSASNKPVKGNPYDNPEEERVIKGSEQATAIANKEIPAIKVTRENHDGLPTITNDPTSNKPNRKATKAYHSSQRSKGNFYGIPYEKF